MSETTRNALIVSLCYRCQNNHVICEGTLKDIDIIKQVLIEKFKFEQDEITVLKEEDATKENFIAHMNEMIVENRKTNFVYFVGHGYSVKNTNKTNDFQENDSGIVLWDGYMLDDELCELVARFDKRTKNLFMFAECYSGGALDLKFNLLVSGERERENKIRKVPSKTVLISAVDCNQVSWVLSSGILFAKNFERVLNENENHTFIDLIKKIRVYCPKQNCSISACFKIDNMDCLTDKKHFSWVRI